jgi:hypothetical protein
MPPIDTAKLPYGGFGTSVMSPEKHIKHLTRLLQSEQALHSLAKRHLKLMTTRNAKMGVLLREMLANGQMTEEQKVAYDLLYMDDGDN